MVVTRAGLHAVAVGAAGGAAIARGLGHCHWAMLAATAPIAAVDIAGALTRAVHYIVGTHAGVAVSAGLLLTEWTPLQLVLLLALLQVVGEIRALRHGSPALDFLTPVALMMNTFVIVTPAHRLIHDRFVGTTIGAALAVGLLLVADRTVWRAITPRTCAAATGSRQR